MKKIYEKHLIDENTILDIIIINSFSMLLDEVIFSVKIFAMKL